MTKMIITATACAAWMEIYSGRLWPKIVDAILVSLSNAFSAIIAKRH
jgi:hypothetical protein